MSARIRTLNDEQQKYLLSLVSRYLSYCPDSGEFTWIRYCGGSTSVGKRAGNRTKPKPNGLTYIRIRLFREEYAAHHLAFLLYYGSWPEVDIDHISGDGTDNRITNLREATTSSNGQNQTRHLRNKSGVTGVHQLKSTGKWWAYICVRKTKINLGYFDTRDEAVEARRQANVTYGFHQNHGRMPITG